jgi:hypothetical protein
MTDILQAARSYYGLADTESCTTQLFTNQAGQTCVAFEIPLSNEDFAAIVQRMQNMQQPDTQPDTAIIEGPTVAEMRKGYDALSKAEKGRYGSFARYMTESSTGIIDVYTGEPYNVPAPPAPPPTRTVVNGRETKESIEATRVWSEQNKAITERQVVHVDTPEEPEPVPGSYEDQARKDIAAAQARVVTHVDAPDEPDPTNMDAVWLPYIECSQAQINFASDMCEKNDGPWHLIQWAMLTDEQKQKAQEAKP